MRKRRAGLREAEPSARRLAVQKRTAATAAGPEPLSEAARARGGEKRRLLLYGLRAAVYAEPGRGASPARGPGARYGTTRTQPYAPMSTGPGKRIVRCIMW